AGLEDGDYLGSALGNFGQKIGVADVVQEGLLLFRRKARQVVHLFGVEADDVAARRVGKRGLGKKFPVRNLAEACYQTILSESLAVEEHAASQLERGREIPVVVVVELLHVNAHVGQQTLGLGAVERGAFNRLGTVTEQQPVARVELFLRGVPAEVVVRFENQDARICAGLLAEEVSRCESGDACAHHDEIVGAIGGSGGTGVLPKSSVAQTVRGFERTGIIAAHPGARRRVVTGAILRGVGIRGAESSTTGQGGTERQATDPDGDSVQKIAARNGAVHAEIAIACVVRHYWSQLLMVAWRRGLPVSRLLPLPPGSWRRCGSRPAKARVCRRKDRRSPSR